MALSEDRIREELKQVIDPELFVNIVDLGLVYQAIIEEGEDEAQDVRIEMTLTSPMCPSGPQLIGDAKRVLTGLEEVGEVDVKIVMSPPWSPERMTEDARDQLGIF